MKGNTMKNVIEQISEEYGITKKLAKEVVDSTIKTLIGEIVNNGELRVHGLGTFTVKTKPARMGHNPKTGEAVQIPERKVVKFSTAKGLKAAI
jgi:nucleoid DNA-binding protein